ncbi:MAG: hypothetical protein WA799_03755 [Nitrosotalea sp.]
MHTKMQYAALMACALLIIPAAAFAQTATTQSGAATVQQDSMNAALAQVTCQANYLTGYIGDAISVIPNINSTAISADSSKITTDLQTVTTDTNNDNKTQFKTDLPTLRADFQSGRLDLNHAIKTSTPTKTERSQLRSDMTSLGTTERSCMFAAEQQSAQAKIASFQFAIQQTQTRSHKLYLRGFDTTQLNQTISQAQTNLGNLAAAISSATNSTQLKAALQSYCQYDGCKSGTNFHFAAQSAFDVEQAALNAIKSNPNSGQYSTQISQAQTDLNNAQSILSPVGTGQYQGTQSTDVWNNLHDTQGIINQIWHDLNGHGTSSGSSLPSSNSGTTSG